MLFQRIAFCVLILVVISQTILAQNHPIPPKYSTNPVVEYALNNVQQEGEFYFLPFPYQEDSSENDMAIQSNKQKKGTLPVVMQTILLLCRRFQEIKDVELVGPPEIIRDQTGKYEVPATYGLLLKAIPKKK